MIHPQDIATPVRCDLSAIWRKATGDTDATATANIRNGRISSLSVLQDGLRPLAMCRTGAAAILSEPTITAIEAIANGRTSHVCR